MSLFFSTKILRTSRINSNNHKSTVIYFLHAGCLLVVYLHRNLHMWSDATCTIAIISVLIIASFCSYPIGGLTRGLRLLLGVQGWEIGCQLSMILTVLMTLLRVISLTDYVKCNGALRVLQEYIQTVLFYHWYLAISSSFTFFFFCCYF